MKTSERLLPNWISAYLSFSAHSEAPTQFHFWTAVSVIAGALRRQVWIDQGYFQWTPNFYIIFVAPPGIVQKSTTAGIGAKILHQLPEIQFGPDIVTWQSLVTSLADSKIEVPLFDDGLYHPMSCITIVSSEFGNFLDPTDRSMVDLLVSLWDGQKTNFEKATKTQGGDIIVNPWVNIIACTTPGWIAGSFPEYLIGGGFTSRCIWVYSDIKRKLVAYPKYHIPEDFQEQQEILVHDLELISQIRGEMTMTPEAIAWGEEWYQRHYELREDITLDQNVWGGYMARKQTHIHKLAIVLSAGTSSDRVITREHLMMADQAVTDLEPNMGKVFALIGKSGDAKNLDRVLGVLQRTRAIDKEVLLKELVAFMGLDAANNAINAGVAAGLVNLRAIRNRVIVSDAVQERQRESHLKEVKEG